VQYRPEIDGLRAVAVLSVILFHAGLSGVPGGYLGVDIFFVISGYLITSIITAEMEAGTFSFVAFYERRARRILPPLFLVVLACVPFALFAMIPRDIVEFSKSLLAVGAFVSNFFFWQQSGYFETDADLKPLLHTWSLGVEEQFYLAFPLLLLLALRLGRRGASALFLAIAIASIAHAQWGSHHAKEATFFLMPGRIWELLMGALIPLVAEGLRRPMPRWVPEFLGLLGLVLIAYAIFVDDRLRYPGFYSLPPTVGALLVIVFSSRETAAGRLLGSRIPVAIGLISYSAYLWHQPLFVFARLIRFHKPDTFVFLALSAVSLALAALTYKFVERPMRNRKRFGRPRVFVLSAAGSICLVSIGLAGVLTGGFESEYISRSDIDSQQTYDLIKRNTGGELTQDMGTDNDCNYWVPRVDAAFRSRFVKCVEKYGPATVVLGDSHGMNIYNALFRANYGKFVVAVADPGCRPWDRSEECPYAGFDDFVANNRTWVKMVIVHFSGSHLILDQAGREEPAKVFEYGWNYRIYDKMIAYTGNYLEQMSTLTRVVWLGPFVEARVDFRDIKVLAKTGFHLNPVSMNIFETLDGAIRRWIERVPSKFDYISFSEIIKPDPNFLRIGDCVTYRDLDHFSVCGEKIVGKSLKQRLSSYSEDNPRG
jgi:peptidoglycan/LPS O-acetylase OafA/YrhL